MHEPHYFNYGHGISAVPEGPYESLHTDDLGESEGSEESESSPRPSKTEGSEGSDESALSRALKIMALLPEMLGMSPLFERMIASELIERKWKWGQINRRQPKTLQSRIEGLRRRKP